jgi:hypothetical protein
MIKQDGTDITISIGDKPLAVLSGLNSSSLTGDNFVVS